MYVIYIDKKRVNEKQKRGRQSVPRRKANKTVMAGREMEEPEEEEKEGGRSRNANSTPTGHSGHN